MRLTLIAERLPWRRANWLSGWTWTTSGRPDDERRAGAWLLLPCLWFELRWRHVPPLD